MNDGEIERELSGVESRIPYLQERVKRLVVSKGQEESNQESTIEQVKYQLVQEIKRLSKAKSVVITDPRVKRRVEREFSRSDSKIETLKQSLGILEDDKDRGRRIREYAVFNARINAALEQVKSARIILSSTGEQMIAGYMERRRIKKQLKAVRGLLEAEYSDVSFSLGARLKDRGGLEIVEEIAPVKKIPMANHIPGMGIIDGRDIPHEIYRHLNNGGIVSARISEELNRGVSLGKRISVAIYFNRVYDVGMPLEARLSFDARNIELLNVKPCVEFIIPKFAQYLIFNLKMQTKGPLDGSGWLTSDELKKDKSFEKCNLSGGEYLPGRLDLKLEIDPGYVSRTDKDSRMTISIPVKKAD